MATYKNGQLPASALVKLSTGGRLRSDAAASFERLRKPFETKHRITLKATDTYRDYAAQVAVRKAKGKWAAVPGTSNHGWGIAVDFASNINNENSAQHKWMDQNAHSYGWVNPAWAQDWNPANGQHEPWHWEYHPDMDKYRKNAPASNPNPKTTVEKLQAAVRAVVDNVPGTNTRDRLRAVRDASKFGGRKFYGGVKFAQSACGTQLDGKWGSKSNAAHDATVKRIQAAVGLRQTGIWDAALSAAVSKAIGTKL